MLVADNSLILPPDGLEPPCNQVESGLLQSPLHDFLTLLYSFDLLSEDLDSGLQVLISLFLGLVPFDVGEQPPRPHLSDLSHQLIEKGRGASEKLVELLTLLLVLKAVSM
jgi:hypothetical protein